MKALDDATRLRMIKLFREGSTVLEISKELDISYSTIWSHQGRAVLQTAFPEQVDWSRGVDLEDFIRLFGLDKGKSVGMEHRDKKAREKGYASNAEYNKIMTEAKKERNRPISTLIKSSLDKKRKNQTWLANCIGVSKQSISDYIKGKIRPDPENLPALAEYLDIDFGTLIRVGRYC